MNSDILHLPFIIGERQALAATEEPYPLYDLPIKEDSKNLEHKYLKFKEVELKYHNEEYTKNDVLFRLDLDSNYKPLHEDTRTYYKNGWLLVWIADNWEDNYKYDINFGSLPFYKKSFLFNFKSNYRRRSYN